MMDIKGGLLLWFKNFLMKSLQAVVLICMQIIKLNKISVLQTWLHINQLKNYTNQLLENLKKEQFIQDSKTIWGADLVDMQLINKFNKGFRFLLCVIDIFSKYAWAVALKDKTFFRKF